MQKEEDFIIIVKEQWWICSGLTSLNKEKLKEKIKIIEKDMQEVLEHLSKEKINEKYVPDERDQEIIETLAHQIKLKLEWKTYMEHFEYKEIIKGKRVEWKTIGYLIFRVKMPENNELMRKIEPNHLQQIIFAIWNELTENYQDSFRFDKDTVPYVFTVSVDYEPRGDSVIKWSKEALMKHKKAIGKWATLFSGQFEDYREELYEKRVKDDLSNRLSEIHIINRNSGFIFMEKENYDKYFIVDEETPHSSGYMYNTVITTTAKFRTVLLAIIIVNEKIDFDSMRLSDVEYVKKDPNEIKEDLDNTRRLNEMITRLVAPFITDLTRTHRQHYHTLLERLMKINKINESLEAISKKIEQNSQILDSLYLKKQQEEERHQSTILGFVNFILSAGIIFEIIGYIAPSDESRDFWLKTIGIIFLAILAVLSLYLYVPRFIKKVKQKRRKKNTQN